MRAPLCAAFLLIFVTLLCRFVQRDDYIVSDDLPYRSGLLENHLFAGKPKVLAYPDLGLVLANSQILRLTKNQEVDIREKAAFCENQTASIKKAIKEREMELKGKVASAQLKGDLSELAPQLNQIESIRSQWLLDHTKCYKEGLQLLSFAQLAEWLPIENLMRPLPELE
ncbi:MAG: hypothetical protein KDK41_12765 [Leptospiraceae bacterium]|nr:hypothetical protein [Leptospiraceae bacterium]